MRSLSSVLLAAPGVRDEVVVEREGGAVGRGDAVVVAANRIGAPPVLVDAPGAADERDVAARLLGALAAAGVVDDSGRAIARYVHAATKKGVLPGGQLESEAVLRLATDGGWNESLRAKIRARKHRLYEDTAVVAAFADILEHGPAARSR